MIAKLHKLMPWLNGRIFDAIFGITVFLNPIGVWSQVYKIFSSGTAASVSALTFSIYGSIQVILMLYGIKIEDWRVVLAMITSVVGSTIIVTAVFLW